jgi:hypothetical protein
MKHTKGVLLNMLKKLIAGVSVFIFGWIIVVLFSSFSNPEQSYLVAIPTAIIYLASVIFVCFGVNNT